ncbi:hypothetical protein VTL71DRAFT_8089, partial [Oculimacula yallundae]
MVQSPNSWQHLTTFYNPHQTPQLNSTLLSTSRIPSLSSRSTKPHEYRCVESTQACPSSDLLRPPGLRPSIRG